MNRSSVRNLSLAEYRELADFRYQIRRFLHFSEGAALAEGIEPRQHQALLAIKAMPADQECTIGALAASLFLQHQSTVGLVDRLERRGLVARTPAQDDARKVIVGVSKEGEDVLRRLSVTHRAELEERGPDLARALRAILQENRSR